MKIEIELTTAAVKMLETIANATGVPPGVQMDGRGQLEHVARRILAEGIRKEFMQAIEGGLRHG